MSKSLKRVVRGLAYADFAIAPLEMSGETRTAEQAANAAGCALDQIAKSIVFRGETSGRAVLIITAGGNKVNAVKASAVACEPSGKANASLIRTQTEFAIGGVSPIGHLSPNTAFGRRHAAL